MQQFADLFVPLYGYEPATIAWYAAPWVWISSGAIVVVVTVAVIIWKKHRVESMQAWCVRQGTALQSAARDAAISDAQFFSGVTLFVKLVLQKTALLDAHALTDDEVIEHVRGLAGMKKKDREQLSVWFSFAREAKFAHSASTQETRQQVVDEVSAWAERLCSEVSMQQK